MPSDITGTDIIEEDPATGRRKLEFLPGPIFANILLADEINRTPPKTQAALLQAMQEREVTVGRRTYPLKPPFFVLATQNPIEQEGTYPLPEAQLDRFMFNIRVDYPTLDEEVPIVKGTTGTHTGRGPTRSSRPRSCSGSRTWSAGVPVADAVIALRRPAGRRRRGPGESKEIEGVHKYLLYGASPRASQYLVLGAKARAILAGKYHVDFADVKALAGPVLRHRLVLNFHARADGVDADAVIRRLLETGQAGGLTAMPFDPRELIDPAFFSRARVDRAARAVDRRGVDARAAPEPLPGHERRVRLAPRVRARATTSAT